MTHPGAAIAALQVFQQAVKILAEWAEFKLPPECTCQTEYPVVSRVKGDILPWRSEDKPQPLRLLFDRVNLDRGQDKVQYWQAGAIAERKPFRLTTIDLFDVTTIRSVQLLGYLASCLGHMRHLRTLKQVTVHFSDGAMSE